MLRDPDRQTAEIQIRIAIMNRYNAFGTAESEAVARAHTGKGQVTEFMQQRPRCLSTSRGACLTAGLGAQSSCFGHWGEFLKENSGSLWSKQNLCGTMSGPQGSIPAHEGCLAHSIPAAASILQRCCSGRAPEVLARLLRSPERSASLDMFSFVSEHRLRDVLLACFHSRDKVAPEVFCVQYLLKLIRLHGEEPMLSSRELGWCFLDHVSARIREAILSEPDTVPRGSIAYNLARRLHSIRGGA